MWYRAGTVTVTNGSPNVTGAGTDFVANVGPGEAFLGPDGRVYEVAQVLSATQLVLAMNYQGATAAGQGYAVMPTQSFARDLALGAAELLNTFAGVRDGIGQGLIADGSVGAPGLRFSADQDTGVRRAGANSVALVAGGTDMLTAGADGVSLGGVVRTSPTIRTGGVASLGLEGQGAGVTDTQLRIVTPERAWHIGQNIGATGVGLLSIYDVTAGAPRLMFQPDGTIRPGLDNAQSLGSAAYRFSTVFAGTGAINTSDAREKQDIEAIPVAWLDAWGAVQWSRFRFRDAVAEKGDAARWHAGLIAQAVREAFAAKGLDAVAIGLICHDRWGAEPAIKARAAVVDDLGEVVVQARPARLARSAGDRWGLRYEECFAIEAAYQRRRLDAIEKRLLSLNVKL